MTSMKSVRCMAKHTKTHIQYNRINGLLMKHGDTWPILTLAQKMVRQVLGL